MRAIAFIDASNLFYGGEKSLRWKIDYSKLLQYLKHKYNVSTAYYFGGVEIYQFPFDYLEHPTVPLEDLENYLRETIQNNSPTLNEAELILLGRHLQKARFYRKLEKFGFHLCLKPVKSYDQDDGSTKRKANCDVDMAFYLMKEKGQYDQAVILSGDGDFLPVLKHLREEHKKITVLARGPRTAREIRQFAGADFRDFVRLQKYISL